MVTLVEISMSASGFFGHLKTTALAKNTNLNTSVLPYSDS